ncbi:TlpA family protein disulfide reductase [Natrinema salaciae]|uniref:Thioredoxin domain-containing protein n=1 Tax=Natrinema salaciae TaxID=1186196 RepID=A0A1H9GTT4_9EURY|nr:hypothetical protein [Natrinema salaciae]SEQ53474.1 hypothetical protein SAMN04489841_1993 [Natrinema salaciae]
MDGTRGTGRSGFSIDRRELLASAAGMPALVGCLDGGADDGDDGDGGTDTSGDGAGEPPFEIATIDAPGSEAGTVQIPQSGRVTCCNFTRTQCPTSRGLLPTLGEAKTRLENEGYAVGGDDPAIRFLSVTDATSGPSPSDDELAAWFDENGGDWPLGRDETGASYEYYEIDGYPTTIVLDGAGESRWRNAGDTTASTVVTAVETALEEG